MAEQITRIDVEGLDQFKAALLGLSKTSGPKVRAALKEELKDVQTAMRANAGQNLWQRQRGSDFKKSIKSYVFYRNKRDIDLDKVGGAVKAYGGFWIAHETGAVITRGPDKWLLIVLPEGAREYGGKRRNRYPIGTIVRPIDGKGGKEMLGVFRPLKTKLKLIAVLKKVVTLRARLALTETGKHASRHVARNLVNQITLGRS